MQNVLHSEKSVAQPLVFHPLFILAEKRSGRLLLLFQAYTMA